MKISIKLKNHLNKLAVVAILIAFIGNLFIGSVDASMTEEPDTKTEEFYEDKELQKTFKDMNDYSKTTTEIKNELAINELKNNVANLIATKKVKPNAPLENYDYKGVTALEMNQAGSIYTSITLPVKGDNYSLISNLTLVFNQDSSLSTYSESLITKSDDNKFIISNFMDGKLIENKATDLDYVSDADLQKGLENLQNTENINVKQSRGFGNKVACIAAVLGIGGSVAYLIAGTCTAACLTVNPVCATCIGGICTLGAGGIGGVVTCFTL